MPELDGRDATRILRKRGYDFPIIALTAHAVPSEKEKCIKAGCDEVLTKPINRDDLINTIKQKMARKKRIDSSSIEGETGHLETT
jgi:CheY-like chemotaxis protein